LFTFFVLLHSDLPRVQKGLPWSASKGYDTFCPVGDFVPAGAVRDPHALELWLAVRVAPPLCFAVAAFCALFVFVCVLRGPLTRKLSSCASR
jgi:hypothetical protein